MQPIERAKEVRETVFVLLMGDRYLIEILFLPLRRIFFPSPSSRKEEHQSCPDPPEVLRYPPVSLLLFSRSKISICLPPFSVFLPGDCGMSHVLVVRWYTLFAE